jgi:hypothetical protein
MLSLSLVFALSEERVSQGDRTFADKNVHSVDIHTTSATIMSFDGGFATLAEAMNDATSR